MLQNKKLYEETLGHLSKDELQQVKDRRTGRSTKCALQILARCYIEPNKWVAIEDHHPTREADKLLLGTIREMVAALGFEGFVFNKSRNEIMLEVDFL